MNPQDALQSYIQIDRQSYDGLIQRLVSEVEAVNGSLSNEQREALDFYFSTALTKGADFSTIKAEDLAVMPVDVIRSSAMVMPGKLSTDSRQKFEEIGNMRTPPMKWNKLFPDGTDEIILPIEQDAQSVNERIEDYIKQHNEQAKLNFEEAMQAEDNRSAGNTIDQQQIRRNPNDPSKLEVLNPKKPTKEDGSERWLPGQRLGAFLEARNEWALLDDFQLDNSRQKRINEGKNGKPLDLREMLERNTIDSDGDKSKKKPSADSYDPDSLRVVISRDPQKIGEMSSNQHWDSCMSEVGGLNFHYVPADIQAGTLCAYLVSKDDPQARYPLMRQLIKPYYNLTTGEVAMVPAKIYGADVGGNSRTRQALHDTLNNFVRDTVNQGKKGEFMMDSRLYGDGQPGLTVLQAEWNEASITKGLIKYHDSSMQEWITELERREKDLIRLEERAKELEGRDSNDWAGEIKENQQEKKKLEKEIKRYNAKLRNLTSPEFYGKGFYKEMRTSSPDSLPTPQDVLAVLQPGSNALERSEAMHAAMFKGDVEPLEQYFDKTDMPLEQRVRETRKLALYSRRKETEYGNAIGELWAKYTKQLPTPEARVKEAKQILRGGSKQSVLEQSIDILLDDIEQLETAQDKVKVAQYLDVLDIKTKRGIEFAEIITNDLSELEPRERIEAAHMVIKILKEQADNPKHVEIKARAFKQVIADTHILPNANEKIEFAHAVLSYADELQKNHPDKAEAFLDGKAVRTAKQVIIEEAPRFYDDSKYGERLKEIVDELKETDLYNNDQQFATDLQLAYEEHLAVRESAKQLGAKLDEAKQEEYEGLAEEWKNGAEQVSDVESRLAATVYMQHFVQEKKFEALYENKEAHLEPFDAVTLDVLQKIIPDLPKGLSQASALAVALRSAQDQETQEKLEFQFIDVVADETNGMTPKERMLQFQQLFMGQKELDLDRPVIQKMSEMIVKYGALEKETSKEGIMGYAVGSYMAQPGSQAERDAAEGFRHHLDDLPVEERRTMAAEIMQMISMLDNAPQNVTATKHGDVLMAEIKAVLEGQAVNREESNDVEKAEKAGSPPAISSGEMQEIIEKSLGLDKLKSNTRGQ